MTINNFCMPCPASISFFLTLFVISPFLFEFSCALPSATAYGGTTWINNLQSWDLLPPPDAPLTVRPILLTNNISYNGVDLRFGCGFFCYAIPCDTGYLFATFFVIYASGDDSNPSDLQMVWSANRDHLVKDNATLELTSIGNLVLKDADGTLVWSTNASPKDFQVMRIEESGNLVLFNSTNGTLWQSFDYPTEKLLLGQKLKVGQKLTANNSPTNTSPGIFYGSLLIDYFAMFTATAPPRMYFSYPRLPIPVKLAYMQFDNESLYYYTEGSPSNPIAVSLPIPTNCLFFNIDSNGHFIFYSFQTKIGDSLSDYLSDFTDILTLCEYPRPCGDYGVCTDDGQCSCPDDGNAFDQIEASKPNLGCLPHSPLVCPETPSSPQGYQFLELEHVSYYTYFGGNASSTELVSRDECKNLCLQNCSCKAAFFKYDGGIANFSTGYCYLESTVFSLKKNNPTEEFYNSTAYIKFQSSPKRVKYTVTVISVAVVAGVVVLFFVLWLAWRKKTRRERQEEEKDEEDPVDWPAGLPLRYSFQQLQTATNDFSVKLGSGGFGSVYEGVLPDGTKIAVKSLDRTGQGKKEFRAEVVTLGNIHHVNLVRLKGFSAEKSHRMLVYEHLSNGSLEKWIFPNETHQHMLNWKTRSKVVLHIARGLTYLHEECRERIIHFDIKPQNILLDENFNAKVSDFGLAKLINREQSEVITMMRGTPGYMAPELLEMHISEKADIYSFGVMVVEIVSGKRSRAVSEPGHGLLSVLQRMAEEGRLTDLVESGLTDEEAGAIEEAEKMLEVGMWCIHHDFRRRPAMSTVVKALEGMIVLAYDPSAFTTGDERGMTELVYVPSAIMTGDQGILSSQDSNNMELSYVPKSSLLSGPR